MEYKVSLETIADMEVGQTAIIKEIDLSNFSTRMLAMGLVPGKEVTLVRKQPWHGSYYLSVNNHFIGIRINEAKLIKIETLL